MDKKNVKKLIEYITKEPTEDEHKRGHKYPFMSAEILNSEINKILDFFLIPDAELEMKEKILKNIDNELSFSDEFPDVKPKDVAAEKLELEAESAKKEEESLNKAETEDEFVEVVEENSNKEAEKTQSPESEKDCADNNAAATSTMQVESEAPEEESKTIGEDNKSKDEENNNNQEEKSVEEVEMKKVDNSDDKENEINNNNEVAENYDATTDNHQNIQENVAAEAVKAEEPSDRIELLEFLLEFIETEDELNYVLAGYFSKFFIALLNRNSAAVCFFY